MDNPQDSVLLQNISAGTEQQQESVDEEPNRSFRNRTRFLSRKLNSFDIFMLAICSVFGMGFYINTGVMLSTGGPAAVIYAFAFLGVLTTMIMQNLTTMLRVWPIGSSFVIFIENFVDEDVSRIVGVLYWLTYCFSTATLATALNELLDIYGLPTGVRVFFSIAFLIAPIGCNLVPITVLKWFENAFGAFKLILGVATIILMNYINSGMEPSVQPHQERTADLSLQPRNATTIFHHHENLPNWAAALCACILIASFSFVGIEAVAVTALEARFEKQAGATRQPFHLAQRLPIVITVIYLWGGWIASQNVAWNDIELPSFQWEESNATANATPDATSNTTIDTASDSTSDIVKAIFAISAGNQWSSGSQIVTGLLIAHLASTASTLLYVASRTLFGLSSAVARSEGSQWYIYIATVVSKINKNGVPWVSVLCSSWLAWVPFLRYKSSNTDFNSAMQILSEMASVACIIVWGLISLAAFRCFQCCRKHSKRNIGVTDTMKEVIKVDNSSWYWYRWCTSLLSAILCACIIFAGGAMKYIGNQKPLQGFSIFSVTGILLVGTLLLKIIRHRGNPWQVYSSFGTNFDDQNRVRDIFVTLDDNMKHHSEGMN